MNSILTFSIPLMMTSLQVPAPLPARVVARALPQHCLILTSRPAKKFAKSERPRGRNKMYSFSEYSNEQLSPASVDVERSVLGAILLDNTAYDEAAALALTPSDFSTDSHRRIYATRHTYASWSLAKDVPVAKLAKMMGTGISQIEDTYGRWLKLDEERYGSALDSYGVAAAV